MYVARRGNGHPMAVVCGAERAALWEVRHQNLSSGKVTEGAGWSALELGLGHRRLERKKRCGGAHRGSGSSGYESDSDGGGSSGRVEHKQGRGGA
jgi:hypothetical protein